MVKSRVSPEQVFHWIESYINQYQYSPSLREIAAAMGYQSTSPIRRQLEVLQERGWLDWTAQTARSYRILKPSQLTPIKGVISAHSLMDIFPHDVFEEAFDLSKLLKSSKWSSQAIAQFFALRVRGDSMIDAMIADRDVVIMAPPSATHPIKNGTIVAARVEDSTTLKYFHLTNDMVTLKPANPSYHSTSVAVTRVEIQGVYVGVLRGLV